MKVAYTDAERRFLQSHEACRVATCHDNIPHVVPVSYIFYDDCICFATDYETRKFSNLKGNNRISAVVDEYSSVSNKAVCIQGSAFLIEKGDKFRLLYKIFESRFEWVRREPWGEGEAPFVQILATNKISWGI
ncbi:MAG: pyridoxamine 5'-phosphate oxidase family protein [Nitrososphaera sp.]|jgi:nitroimidazol reductase NimA-like FMN-containing flavoprotein (pyridoxamine 5'-phosphate oxidase superfamily)